jgi:hypothetical protein
MITNLLLFHIYRANKPDNFFGYDMYSSAVVSAPNSDEARRIHPNGDIWNADWYKYYDGMGWDPSTWVESPEQVTAEYIGIATSSLGGGVICAHFNAE